MVLYSIVYRDQGSVLIHFNSHLFQIIHKVQISCLVISLIMIDIVYIYFATLYFPNFLNSLFTMQ